MFGRGRRICCRRRTRGGVRERSQRISVVLRHQQVPSTRHSAELLFHDVLAGWRRAPCMYVQECYCFACFGLLMMLLLLRTPPH